MRLGTLVTSVVMLMGDARTHPSALRCRNARDMHYDCEREAGGSAAVATWSLCCRISVQVLFGDLRMEEGCLVAAVGDRLDCRERM